MTSRKSKALKPTKSSNSIKLPVIYPLPFHRWLIEKGNPDISIAENFRKWSDGNGR